MSKVVVADSTCLIGLARIGRLQILQQLFGEILVAPAVFRETVTDGRGRPGAAEIAGASWIRTVAIENRDDARRLAQTLGAGEAESIVLAAEQHADFLVLDDRHARATALTRGLPVVGTVALLVRAESKGLLPHAAEALEDLRRVGFWFVEGDVS